MQDWIFEAGPTSFDDPTNAWKPSPSGDSLIFAEPSIAIEDSMLMQQAQVTVVDDVIVDGERPQDPFGEFMWYLRYAGGGYGYVPSYTGQDGLYYGVVYDPTPDTEIELELAIDVAAAAAAAFIETLNYETQEYATVIYMADDGTVRYAVVASGYFGPDGRPVSNAVLVGYDGATIQPSQVVGIVHNHPSYWENDQDNNVPSSGDWMTADWFVQPVDVNGNPYIGSDGQSVPGSDPTVLRHYILVPPDVDGNPPTSQLREFRYDTNPSTRNSGSLSSKALSDQYQW